MEDAVYDSQALRQFSRIDLAHEPVPDATTLLKFRHLPKKYQLPKQIFEELRTRLGKQGVFMKEENIVDATIIEASGSTKNKRHERDPQMHQPKKGNEWHFGMKAYIGADAASGPVHTQVTTPANGRTISLRRTRTEARWQRSCDRHLFSQFEAIKTILSRLWVTISALVFAKNQ